MSAEPPAGWDELGLPPVEPVIASLPLSAFLAMLNDLTCSPLHVLARVLAGGAQ